MDVTQEMVEALRLFRRTHMDQDLASAFDVLDNAGIFVAIDEATGYDVDPAPKRVSKCTCAGNYSYEQLGVHQGNCPGDPAEWGDSAYVAQFSRVTDVSGKPWESK